MDGEELLVEYFQQDGASAYTTRETLQYLRELFDEKIVNIIIFIWVL